MSWSGCSSEGCSSVSLGETWSFSTPSLDAALAFLLDRLVTLTGGASSSGLELFWISQGMVKHKIDNN